MSPADQVIPATRARRSRTKVCGNQGQSPICLSVMYQLNRVILVTLALIGLAGRSVAEDAQTRDVPIMGSGETSFALFYAHVASKNPAADEYYMRRLFDAYESECTAEGVNPVVALAQMVHETDYLMFTGSVRPTQYNFAGLGSTGDGTPGLSFGTLDRGVRAHVQHLKAYGSSAPLTRDLVDPRFRYVTRGSARSVMELSGRWATDPDYGEKVLAHAGALMER